LISLCLLISIVLTIINTFTACSFHSLFGCINPVTLGATLVWRCSVVSTFSHPLSSSMLESLSASQSSSLAYGPLKSALQQSQLLVSEMFSVALFLSLLPGWKSTVLIWRKFIIGFALQGGPLDVKLVAMVIFLTISMQPYTYIVRWTRKR